MPSPKEIADNELHNAIAVHAYAYDLVPEDAILNHWAVVAHWQTVEDLGKSFYTTHYPGGSQPNHIIIGLFEIGKGFITEDRDE